MERKVKSYGSHINWRKTKIPAAIKENVFSLTMISLVAATDEESHQPHTHSTQHTPQSTETHGFLFWCRQPSYRSWPVLSTSLSKSMTIFTALVMYCQIIFLQNDFSWFIMQPASMNLPHPLWILAPPTMVFVYLASNVCCLVAVLIGISYIYDCSPSFWNSIYVLTHLSARASIVFAC